jgi:hypothetical protein
VLRRQRSGCVPADTPWCRSSSWSPLLTLFAYRCYVFRIHHAFTWHCCCPASLLLVQQWLIDNPKEDTASLLQNRSKQLRLCVAGKPLNQDRLLLNCVSTTSPPLELLAIGGEADADGDDDAGDD